MKNRLLNIIEKRKLGIHSGIPSFCCANKIVIEELGVLLCESMKELKQEQDMELK